MKKLIAIALLCCNAAHADTAATMTNANNGITVFTDVPCNAGKGFITYAQSPTSSTLYGCWWSDDIMVHVTYSDGDVRSYPFSYLELNLPVLQRMREKQRKGML